MPDIASLEINPDHYKGSGEQPSEERAQKHEHCGFAVQPGLKLVLDAHEVCKCVWQGLQMLLMFHIAVE